MSNRNLTLVIVVLAALALIYTFGVSAGAQAADKVTSPAALEARLIPEPWAIGPFTLTDDNGEALTQERFRGHWTLVYFGYTHCPDVCPTTLSTLTAMQQELTETGAEASPQVLFVSVDPERDTPATLHEYLSHFDSDFIGATGSPEMLTKFTDRTSAVFNPVPHAAGEEYAVEHSASIVLIGPDARLQALFSHPHEASNLATEFRKIRALRGG